MARAARVPALRTSHISGPVHRIVPSRFPPVQLFDAARNAAELEMLADLESLTNPRIRDELGQLRRVPPGEGLFGPGCSPVMAPFCHPAASRFSNGSFGVFYAGLDEETAILETLFHRERILRDASMPPEALEMRRYTSRVLQPMTLLPVTRKRQLLDPDSYIESQRFGAAIRQNGAWGIFYPSVRNAPGGRCVAVLRPKALKPVVQASHYRYFWDGNSIARYERIEQFVVRH